MLRGLNLGDASCFAIGHLVRPRERNRCAAESLCKAQR